MTTNYRTAVSDALLGGERLITVFEYGSAKSVALHGHIIQFIRHNRASPLAEQWSQILVYLEQCQQLDSRIVGNPNRRLMDRIDAARHMLGSGGSNSQLDVLYEALNILRDLANTTRRRNAQIRELLAPFDAHYYEHHGKFLEAQQ